MLASYGCTTSHPKKLAYGLVFGSRLLILANASDSNALVRWTLLGHALGLRFAAPIIFSTSFQKYSSGHIIRLATARPNNGLKTVGIFASVVLCPYAKKSMNQV